MNIFSTRDAVLQQYSDYVRSFLRIADPAIRAKVEEELLQKRALWPEALLQVNPTYAEGENVESLVRRGKLHADCLDIFRHKRQSIQLYRHQSEAVELALGGHDLVVTSGTGSGKSLAYFIPIFDEILRNKPHESKVHAIVVYPMNALVNSQDKSLRRLAEDYKERTGREMPVRFAKYTGQEGPDEKRAAQQNPPHILLTNYVMLELMLVRNSEREFVDQTRTALRFLVLDELHTYRGRQGADVAMLVRRLRERAGNPDLICIGTSATMATGDSPQERRQAVATFAGRLFGVDIPKEHVVEETLQRAMASDAQPSREVLRQAVGNPLPRTWEQFRIHPLSVWMENTFGLRVEDGGNLRRATPIPVNKGAARLAEDTELPVEQCQHALQQLFLHGSQVIRSDEERALAFKLHQFVSQGGSVYATMDAPPHRYLTMNGQYYAPGEGERPLYPLVFCRVCGQEYYVVQRSGSNVKPDVETWQSLASEDEDADTDHGYVMLDPDGRWRAGRDVLPDHWLDSRGNVQRNYRPYQPEAVVVSPSGELLGARRPGGTPGWYLRKPFLLCLNCAEAYTLRDKNDYRKLARLSSEGRSTATTLLALSTVSSLRGAQLEPSAQKVLSFTDNRQDASLQAGHFNDFVQVALLRSAIHSALRAYGELRFDNVAQRVAEHLNLPLEEYAAQKGLYPDAPQAREVRNAFCDLIEYRIYEDLRRGWRVVQPNLEQCGLLTMDYHGLRELTHREDVWEGVPFLRGQSPARREELLRTVLDEMRRQLAIEVHCLDPKEQEQLVRRVDDYLREHWAFGGERLRCAARYVQPEAERLTGDYSLSTRSTVGRWLRSEWQQAANGNITTEEYNQFLGKMVDALLGYGLLTSVMLRRGRNETVGVRIPATALVWRLGDGRPLMNPLRRRQATGDVYAPVEEEANVFFRELYSRAAADLRWARGAAHTAQVGYEQRTEREDDFREGTLSCLFCSPTMELGVDIADLNAVHLRNVPPTPANYAQRSGRAGRAGQPALVMTYCSNYSGHDQYYFQRRAEVVAGTVVPPRLDLGNEDLVRAHVQAVWLATTGADLGGSVPEILDMASEDYALRPDVRAQITLSEGAQRRCTVACQRVLEACGPDVQLADWYHDDWLAQTIRSAPERFDQALDRWREMFRLVQQQFYEAQKLKEQAFFKSRGEGKDAEVKAQALEREAVRQRGLLFCDNTRAEESDFYPYRYLASEGFLPGYNFPALPVRAYLARGSEGEYISRPRMLAIQEFGPGNIIYHEGSKFVVNRVFLSAQDPEGRFTRAKVCKACGYIHDGEAANDEICHHCGVQMNGDNAPYLTSLLEMPGVSTLRRERITCDEEERRREGYEIETCYQFAPAPGGHVQQRRADVLGGDGSPLLELTLAPQASLWRVNHRWRRSQQHGYLLDMSTGRWLSQEDADKAAPGTVRSDVRLFTRQTANAMLVRVPPTRDETVGQGLIATLQYALARGIQEEFQVEEGELSVERLGEEGNQRILLWEAAEGGLGVLRRLVEEPDAVRRVARRALDILHFDPQDGRDLRPPDKDDSCTKACYDCVLSYYNQRDHPHLDRHLVLDTLLRLADATTQAGGEARDYDAQYRWLREHTDTRSDLERQFLDALYAKRRRLPDAAQRPLGDAYSIPDFYLEPNVCVFCDGSVHDEPQTAADDMRIRRQLRMKGYHIIVIRYDRELEAQIAEHEDIFGEAQR